MRTVSTITLTAAIVLAATVVLAGCSPRPTRTVSLDGERWIVYEGSQSHLVFEKFSLAELLKH